MKFCKLSCTQTKAVRFAKCATVATLALLGSGISPALALTHTDSSPEALAEELDLAAQPDLAGSPLLHGVRLGMLGLEIIQVLIADSYECDFDYAYGRRL